MAFPYPAYEVPGSAPLTMMAAAILLEPWTRFRLSSPYPDPSTQSHHDEVPVDVVVNRLVVHLAAGTQGIVHAVSGPERRFASGALFAAMNKERRLFWKLKLSWRNVDWHTRDIHMVGRIYVVSPTRPHLMSAATKTRGPSGRLAGHESSWDAPMLYPHRGDYNPRRPERRVSRDLRSMLRLTVLLSSLH